MQLKIRLFAAVAVFLVGSCFFVKPGYAVGHLSSGADCKASNLGQALQGITNNQFGVQNDNASRSFFVVCPIDLDDDIDNYTGLQISATFPPGGGEMSCNIRWQNVTTGAFTAFRLDISATTEIGQALTSFAAQDVNVTPNVTVVCPLDPGEGIRAIAVFR